jgi:transketolase C-terminal domain/subunit
MPVSAEGTMLNRTATLRYVGRFSLLFSLAVFLLGRRYENIGLISIAAGIAIIGMLCISDSAHHHAASRAGPHRPRPQPPSGELR